jgi:hypothetical protein
MMRIPKLEIARAPLQLLQRNTRHTATQHDTPHAGMPALQATWIRGQPRMKIVSSGGNHEHAIYCSSS